MAEIGNYLTFENAIQDKKELVENAVEVMSKADRLLLLDRMNQNKEDVGGTFTAWLKNIIDINNTNVQITPSPSGAMLDNVERLASITDTKTEKKVLEEKDVKPRHALSDIEKKADLNGDGIIAGADEVAKLEELKAEAAQEQEKLYNAPSAVMSSYMPQIDAKDFSQKMQGSGIINVLNDKNKAHSLTVTEIVQNESFKKRIVSENKTVAETEAAFNSSIFKHSKDMLSRFDLALDSGNIDKILGEIKGLSEKEIGNIKLEWSKLSDEKKIEIIKAVVSQTDKQMEQKLEELKKNPEEFLDYAKKNKMSVTVCFEETVCRPIYEAGSRAIFLEKMHDAALERGLSETKELLNQKIVETKALIKDIQQGNFESVLVSPEARVTRSDGRGLNPEVIKAIGVELPKLGMPLTYDIRAVEEHNRAYEEAQKAKEKEEAGKTTEIVTKRAPAAISPRH